MSDDFIDKLWALIEGRQEAINKQLFESERKFILRMEEKQRIIENSERKFFELTDLKNLAIKDLDHKILKQLEENRARQEREKEEENKKTLKRKRRRELCDIIIEVTFSAEQKQNKENFINHIYRLTTILQEAGYKIVDNSDNVIKIAAE